MKPFPYLGDFSEVLPYHEIIKYHKSVPYDSWTPICSPKGEHTYKYRPDVERNQCKFYNENNALYKELPIRDKGFFPDSWFKLVGARKEGYQAKVLCTKPGNTEPPHRDFFPGFLGHTKDNGDNYTQEDIKLLGKDIIRCWIPLMDSKLGHLLFSEEYALSSWKLGEVFELPAGVTHGFGNAGREDRYVLVFTNWRE